MDIVYYIFVWAVVSYFLYSIDKHKDDNRSILYYGFSGVLVMLCIIALKLNSLVSIIETIINTLGSK